MKTRREAPQEQGEILGGEYWLLSLIAMRTRHVQQYDYMKICCGVLLQLGDEAYSRSR